MSVDVRSPELEERPYVAAPLVVVPNLAQPAAAVTLTACSLCLRVLRDGEWTEAESAIRDLRSFDRAAPPRLEPAVCSSCAEAIYGRRAHAPGAPASG